MDVAHDTINSTQGPALIEVAYSPFSEGKGQGSFFVVIVGGSHEIYAGRRNQTKVEGPADWLRDIAKPSPGAIPRPSSRRAGRAWIQTRPYFSFFELLPRWTELGYLPLQKKCTLYRPEVI